ncbi:hypothetical protein EXN66_Car009564 [Channa argus]|uniref:Uncharacterized protein n=1 Tax=Channa argus TaxID=215402 RepID=A0A6G1PV87_CHAAH|nr:hypothetical protein EXN66_Car009564 [Channa argus]
MPPRAANRNVYSYVIKMQHFAIFFTLHSGTAQADLISKPDGYGLFLGRLHSLKWN